MRLFSIILAGMVFCFASAAQGQDIVVIEYGKCDGTKMAELRQQADSVWFPTLQELVKEGQFTYAQVLEADMADEWNVVWYYRAKDYDTFWSAYEEWGKRVVEKYPEAWMEYNEHCPEWRRFSYKSTVQTEMP